MLSTRGWPCISSCCWPPLLATAAPMLAAYTGRLPQMRLESSGLSFLSLFSFEKYCSPKLSSVGENKLSLASAFQLQSTQSHRIACLSKLRMANGTISWKAITDVSTLLFDRHLCLLQETVVNTNRGLCYWWCARDLFAWVMRKRNTERRERKRKWKGDKWFWREGESERRKEGWKRKGKMNEIHGKENSLKNKGKKKRREWLHFKVSKMYIVQVYEAYDEVIKDAVWTRRLRAADMHRMSHVRRCELADCEFLRIRSRWNEAARIASARFAKLHSSRMCFALYSFTRTFEVLRVLRISGHRCEEERGKEEEEGKNQEGRNLDGDT